MPTPILTACRQAVWTAIDTHVPLQGVFKRRYKFEDKPGGVGKKNLQPNPTMGEIPALAIYPAQPSSGWVLNQNQQVMYPLQFTFWTADWDVLKAEFLWEELIKAVYLNLEPGTGASNRVIGFSPLAAQSVELADGPAATQWTFVLDVRAAFWNPRVT